jgi:hypothetical protein
MSQAVICLPLTAEVRARSQTNPHGICGGQGDSVLQVLLVFPVSFHQAPQSFIHTFITDTSLQMSVVKQHT